MFFTSMLRTAAVSPILEPSVIYDSATTDRPTPSSPIRWRSV